MATASIKVNFTGRIYAYYGGDLLTRHEAPTASAIHAFTVPTRMAVSMFGAYKTSGGVLYYHSGGNVHLHVLVGPPHTRQLFGSLLEELNEALKSAQPIQFPGNIELVKKHYDKIDAALN